MKICLIGIDALHLGKHNVKDPRLDQVDRLVEAKKRVYAQADLVGPGELADADSILVTRERYPDLILADLERIETRLGRSGDPAERALLDKLRAGLENEQTVHQIALSSEERRQANAHGFSTAKPVVLAAPEELAQPEELVVRALRESGYICFLTVGGKENRAWPIRRGATAVEAAGSIHTDIQKGFIRAEVIALDDLVAAGGETQAKRAGKLRLETKDYIVQDYDVLNFRFNK